MGVLFEFGDTFTLKATVLRTFLKPHTDDTVCVHVRLEAPDGTPPVTFICEQGQLAPMSAVTPMSAEALAALDKADEERQEQEKVDALRERRMPVLMPRWREQLDSLPRSK